MAILWLLVVWLSWGISYPVTAIALRGFDVLTLRCAVTMIGAAALFLQAAVAGRRFTVEREAWPDLVIAGLLNMAVFPILMVLGIYLVSPGRTSILVYTMPIWASLFARLMLGEPLTPNRIAALFLGAAAVAALLSQDLSHLKNAPLGAALTILGAMAFGLGTVWLKRRRWRADPSVVAFWQLVVGLVPLILIWLVLVAPPDVSRAGRSEWLALLFIGLTANGAAYFAWFRLVGVLPASISGISSLVIPAIAVAASAGLGDERLHAQDFAAMVLIGAALLSALAEQLGIGWRARARPAAD